MTTGGRSRADWTALRTFGAVVEHGGFGAAARALCVSPSTVTRHIDELEGRLDARLLYRTGQGASLTEAGHAIFAYVRTMENSAQALEREVLRLDSRPEGEVHLSLPDGLAAFFIGPAMPAFLQANPKIRLTMDCGFWPDNPLDGDTDIALTFAEPTNPDVIAKAVGHFHYALFAAPSYLEIYGTPETLEAATPHRYVHHVALTRQPENWATKLSSFFTMANRSVTTNSSAVSLQAVKNGAGIGLLPTGVTSFAPELVMLQDRPLATLKLWMYYHRDVAQSARVRLVINWLEDLFDHKTCPWFRPEFIHPDQFGEAAKQPITAVRKLPGLKQAANG
jgi:DNA-binding transcriptional LysR family regulator